MPGNSWLVLSVDWPLVIDCNSTQELH